MSDNLISIPFEINGFSDALNLSSDHTFTEIEIEAMKQSHYNTWYAHINTLPAIDSNINTFVEE